MLINFSFIQSTVIRSDRRYRSFRSPFWQFWA